MAYMARITAVDVDVDVQEGFDELKSSEQRYFLIDNINVLKDDDLFDELRSRGYSVAVNE